MNMNDLRASAYANGMGKSPDEKKSDKKDSSIVKPFVPPRIKKIVSDDDKKTGPEKRLFEGVDKKIGKILENRKDFRSAEKESPAHDSAEYLKSGGLLKVPVSPKEADGSDSVYRRVAKILLLVGIDEAAKILPHLTAEQTEKIIPEIASIRSVSPEEAAVILEEFNGLLEKSRESGGVETAREILEKAYGPEKAREMLEKSAPFGGAKPFDYLNDADSERIF